MNINRKQKHPIVDGKPCLEIEIQFARQLFDERDPAPFRQKDLDDDAVEYLITSMQEISVEKVGKLFIYITDDLDASLTKEDIIQAFHKYFKYQSELTEQKIKTILTIGFKSLLIGLTFLVGATTASLLLKSDTESFLNKFLKEGLLLLGWVSMWKPINTFLYEWWPYAEIKQIHEKLSQIEIVVLQKKQGE